MVQDGQNMFRKCPEMFRKWSKMVKKGSKLVRKRSGNVKDRIRKWQEMVKKCQEMFGKWSENVKKCSEMITILSKIDNNKKQKRGKKYGLYSSSLSAEGTKAGSKKKKRSTTLPISMVHSCFLCSFLFFWFKSFHMAR